ncbi:GNAT family N-acetyltransferase [Aeromicrobium wangtongii]|uniref:GNAT family N-acetyltransferase n=1 Tax=Aeromicrobium wangtongii TaxID=2969247 RepID=UPI0020182816|nr:GNAT family protein [Aeromicrobium wangtongii]MCL3817047.1 GNAT family N-acetyltransferase [Aeromicrobium wangtongii]
MTTPLENVDWPLPTQRLVLRRFDVTDIPAIHAYRVQPQVTEWITGRAVSSESLASRFGDGSTAVIAEHEGRLIGDLMVRVNDAYAQREVAAGAAGTQAELGWTFDPAFHGRGLATEAVGELLRICFEELGLRRVTAGCFTGNEASWRLMERLGMRREAHHVQDSLHRDHGWQDGYVYALLADEWRA